MSIAMVGLRGIPATHGGIEHAVEQLSTRMAARGHDVTAYARSAYSPKGLRVHQGVRIVRLPQIPTKHLEALSHTLLALLHVVFSRRYDIVHIHATGPSLLAFIPRLAGIRTVVTVHGLDWQRARWGPLATGVLRLAAWAAVTVPHGTIAVSRDLAATIRRTYGRAATYVTNGVEVPESSGSPVAGLDPNGFVLFLGRLVPEKEIDTLIRAYGHVAGRVPLVIAGPGQRGDGYVDRLVRLASRDPRVRLIGPVYGEEKTWLLQNAAVFVQPSSVEGLPIGLLEAIAAGTYPVVSSIAPHLEILDTAGAQLGGRVPVGDSAALGVAIDTALGAPSQCSAEAQLLRNAVRASYDWDSATSKTIEVYRMPGTPPSGRS